MIQMLFISMYISLELNKNGSYYIVFLSEKKNPTYPAWKESQNAEKIWWMSVDISWRRNSEQKMPGISMILFLLSQENLKTDTG